jgi:hypothetical protein
MVVSGFFYLFSFTAFTLLSFLELETCGTSVLSPSSSAVVDLKRFTIYFSLCPSKT